MVGDLTGVSGRSCQGQRLRIGGKGEAVSGWQLLWGLIPGVGWAGRSRVSLPVMTRALSRP